MLTNYKIITNNVQIGDRITPHHIYLFISKFPEIVLTYWKLFLHDHIYEKCQPLFYFPLHLNNIIMLFFALSSRYTFTATNWFNGVC